MNELDNLINQFLFNYVDDDDFDEAKDHLIGLMKIARDYPDEIDKLFKE